MALFNLNKDINTLRAYLKSSDAWLVACFCAQWCNVCTTYYPAFQNLAHRLTQYAFAWIDIEEQAEYLGDEEIENFPTLLIKNSSNILFYGPLPPYINQLERLLVNLHNTPLHHRHPIKTSLPTLCSFF